MIFLPNGIFSSLSVNILKIGSFSQTGVPVTTRSVPRVTLVPYEMLTPLTGTFWGGRGIGFCLLTTRFQA